MPLFKNELTTLSLSETRTTPFDSGEVTTLGLVDHSEQRGNPLNDPAVPLSSPAVWQWLLGGEPTASGELVNEQTALQITTVYACVRVIAESVASLPLKLYELLPSGRQEATDSLLYYLLSVEPNPEMSAFTYWETIAGCCALTGNSYAQIERNDIGQAVALWPLNPLKTEPLRLKDNTLAFKTSDGMTLGQTRIIPAKDVLHNPLFSFDGLRGLSPIGLARQSLGLAKATEKFGARFFGNGTRPGGILSSKSTPDPKVRQELRESWNQQQGGVNQGKTAFLYGDWTYQQIGLSPEDSQFLATRQFQRAEIAGHFRVPPQMVGDTTRLSNNNHEQQSLSFVTDTLRPYLARFEAEIVRKLLPTQGRKANKYVVSFDVTERLRGDFATTMAGFATGRQWGWLSGNDVRKQLGMNPGGPELDSYLVPVNMIDARALSKEPADPIQSDVPTAGERQALGNLSTAYLRLFRDAVGRAIKREKRDITVVSELFTPVLTSLSEEVERLAALRFALDDGWNESRQRNVREALKAIEKRAADWTAEQVDDITGQEFTRAVKAIVLSTYRDAGAVTALKGL